MLIIHAHKDRCQFYIRSHAQRTRTRTRVRWRSHLNNSALKKRINFKIPSRIFSHSFRVSTPRAHAYKSTKHSAPAAGWGGWWTKTRREKLFMCVTGQNVRTRYSTRLSKCSHTHAHAAATAVHSEWRGMLDIFACFSTSAIFA